MTWITTWTAPFPALTAQRTDKSITTNPHASFLTPSHSWRYTTVAQPSPAQIQNNPGEYRMSVAHIPSRRKTTTEVLARP